MTRIFLRRGTSSELSSVVLATGEAAYATDTKALKVGDGSNNFASLSGLGGGGGGVSAFTALSDTPSNFSGAASKFVKVNSGASAIEFVAGTSSGGISGVIDDTSPQLGGNLDLNSKDLTGTGDINITGSGQFSSKIQASSLVKTGGTSSQFLKGDGSVDTTTYLSAHPTIGSAASSVDNSGRTYIQDITLDGNGHVTGLTSATETVTDTNTTYTAGSGLTLVGTQFNADIKSNPATAGGGTAINNIVAISSGDYAALSSKNGSTLYFIT